MRSWMASITPYLAALTLLLGGVRPVTADYVPTQPATAMNFSGGPAADGAITLNALDTGWYDQTGSHDAEIKNYIAGRFENIEYRDFAVFDLSSLSETIVRAQLQLFNPGPPLPGYSSPKPFEIDNLFDVSTSVTNLRANQTGRTDIFADLGTGIPYGAQSVSAADDGTVVRVNLNPAGLAALNAALGGQFALGGAITTLDTTSADEYIFGFSNGPRTVQLVVTAVPEPASLVLMGTGLVAPLVYDWRRRRTSRI
jgi:large repetitive protein